MRSSDQPADGVFHHQQGGDVVVDGEDGIHPSSAAADIDGGGFQDFPVRGAGQIGQVVLGVLRAVENLLHDDGRGSVPHSAPGDVPILDVDNGLFRVGSGEIVNDDLAIGAKLGGQG